MAIRNFPTANRNGSTPPSKSTPSTDFNPLNVHDTAVKEGGLIPHQSGDLKGFLETMLGSGRYDVGDSEFQWLFEHYWNLHNAEQSQNWAREDAYVSWLRSLESSKFNAKLGLETSRAANAQLFNQLVGLGMSPMAAMQMLSGSSGSGSGSGSAPVASTQQVQSVSPVGSNRTDRINAAINGISTIFSAVSNFGLGIKRLKQDDTHFNKSLEWQKESFQRANWMNDELYNAATSEEFKTFWNNAIKYASSDCPSSALTSPLAFRKHLASEDGNDLLNDEFNALRSKYGWAADSYFDSQFANVINSQGQDTYLKIQKERLSQMELETELSRVNLRGMDTKLQWFSDKYEDYQKMRETLNAKNLLQIQWQLDRLKMVAGDADMVALVKQEIKGSLEAKAALAQINALINSGVLEKFDNSDLLEQLLTTKRILDMCGVSQAASGIGTVVGAVATKGKSLVHKLFNSQNDVTEPEFHLDFVDDFGNRYYYDYDDEEYKPYDN